MSELATSDLIPVARQEGDAVVLAIRGEIDMHNTPQLRHEVMQVLNKIKPRKLVVDLGQVGYMDSSAIAVLVESLKILHRIGGKVCLINLQPRVKGILEISRLNAVFSICKDEQEALAK
jgi:anti-anti-sigma factor